MSNNNTAANPTVPETNGDLPFKLDVRVRPIAPMGNLLAYANVTIGEYALYPGQQRKLA